MNKTQLLDEKLGKQENFSLSFEERIGDMEEKIFEQNKLLQSLENSSKDVLEIVEKELKVDIRNSKEELRKQREYINHKACIVQFSTILLLLSPARPCPHDPQVLHDKDPSSARCRDAPFKVGTVTA